jgi:hypothetical protein
VGKRSPSRGNPAGSAQDPFRYQRQASEPARRSLPGRFTAPPSARRQSPLNDPATRGRSDQGTGRLRRLRVPDLQPTGNLDEDTRDEIIGLLEVMWRERGLTMVLVTHDSTVARRAQRIGVMKNGRLTFRKAARAQAALSPRSSSSASSGLQPPDLPAAKGPSVDSVRADE